MYAIYSKTSTVKDAVYVNPQTIMSQSSIVTVPKICRREYIRSAIENIPVAYKMHHPANFPAIVSMEHSERLYSHQICDGEKKMMKGKHIFRKAFVMVRQNAPFVL